LATISGTAHGQLVASQLMDVTVRVAPVRPFVVEAMLGLLLDQRLVLGPGRATLHEVLQAAAWVVGEYAPLVPAVAASAWKRAKEVHKKKHLGLRHARTCGRDFLVNRRMRREPYPAAAAARLASATAALLQHELASGSLKLVVHRRAWTWTATCWATKAATRRGLPA
jgi:hypothetical protein